MSVTPEEPFVCRYPDCTTATASDDDEYIAAVVRLSRDLRIAAASLSEREAKYLVAAYYNVQELRIRSKAQQRKLDEATLPSLVVGWLGEQTRILEDQVRAALDKFSAAHPYAQWPRSVIGIGPVIAAGLVANFDTVPPPTAGHWWSFAGLNPDMVWNKNEKRPYSAMLKVLAFKISGSFVKFSGHPNDTYGKYYREKKAELVAKNEKFGFRANAEKALATKNWRTDKAALGFYQQGLLPPGHVDNMARRWVAKLFIGHYHHVCFGLHYHEDPPKPYVISHLGHAHMITPPDWRKYL